MRCKRTFFKRSSVGSVNQKRPVLRRPWVAGLALILMSWGVTGSALAATFSTDFEQFAGTQKQGTFVLFSSPFSVSFEGGFVGTLGVPKLYHSGLSAFMANPGITATVTFETPASQVTLFFIDQSDASVLRILDTNGQLLQSFNGNSSSFTKVDFTAPAGKRIKTIELVNGNSGVASLDDFSFTATQSLMADLEVSQTASSSTLMPGDNVTFSASVKNNGPDGATAVTLTDTLPDGTTLVSNTPSQGSCSLAGSTLSCNLGQLANGATATLDLVVTVTKSGSLTNTLTASATEEDPNSDNNRADVSVEVSFPFHLFYAQFARGGGLFSQLVLFNPDPNQAASVHITVRNKDGQLFSVDLMGMPEVPVVDGQLDVMIPPGGLRSFQTGSDGNVQVGSVVVDSDRQITGVVVFGGSVGLAGVGSSERLSNGFVAPVQTHQSNGTFDIDAGIAVMNLEGEEVTLMVELLDANGNVVATAMSDPDSTSVPARGQRALFVDQFKWDSEVDFSDFQGTLRVTSSGDVAATVIQLRSNPSQFASLPVSPR